MSDPHGGTRRSPSVVIVGSEPSVVVPVARALARRHLRCVVVVPPTESFSLCSRAVADVLHLDGSSSDATSLLGMIVESERAGLVLPTSGAALELVSGLVSGVRPHSVPLDAAIGVGVLMHDGVPVATFQQRTILLARRGGGSEAVAESMALDPHFVEQSVCLLRAIKLEGPALVEFVPDPSTGEYGFASVQGHLWTSIALALRAGVDFPKHMWDIAHDVPPQSQDEYTVGVRIPWKVRSGAGGRTLSALWSWSDPVPSIQEHVALLNEWVATRARQALRRLVSEHVARTLQSTRTLPPEKRWPYLVRRATRSTASGRKATLPSKVKSVLFVCHGNVMRSAAAEHFLRAAAASGPLAGLEISSAGTHARMGRSADERVQRAALELGVSLESHRSRPLDGEMVHRADVIFAMDDVNVVNIVSQYPDVAKKTLLLGGIAASESYDTVEILDPYFASDEGVATTIRFIHAAVTQLAHALLDANIPGTDR